ncbi:MAG: hypothetical protein LBJ09_03360 [Clostridiales bacterium]|jgi:Ser-tRNA(Ala) deacylase AlaX|nr:hypothetical protein [Clostridiales bacterium]
MQAVYYKDKYLKEIETKIEYISNQNDKCYIKFEKSIFYPKGGGQKGDRGKFFIEEKEFKIIDSVKDEKNESISILEFDISDKFQGETVKCILDWNFRLNQMKLHTCLHLHHCIIEEIGKKNIPYPKISSIEDGFAFNKYENSDFDIKTLEKINERFLELLKTNIEVKTYPDANKKGFRWWEFDKNKIPCGGIHVSKLSEIGDIKIDTSTKKSKINIKFTL